MTQEKLDFDLNSLVDFLTTRGTKASAATIERLAKASAAITNAPITGVKTQEITDDDRRETLYFRQAGALATAVKELKAWLDPLDPLYPIKPLDYRLRVLFELLASTAVLARRCIDDDVADKLLKREHTTPATETRLENVQQTKVEIIIGEELDRFRKERPDEFRKLRRNGRGQHAIAGRIRGAINKRLKNELRRKSLGGPMIAQYVKKDPHF